MLCSRDVHEASKSRKPRSTPLRRSLEFATGSSSCFAEARLTRRGIR